MMYVGFATFVKRDIEILSTRYQVDNCHFNTSKKYFLPVTFLKQFFFLLFRMKTYKKVIIQSSGYVSFLPVIFNKIFNVPVIVIAIGTDCAKLPEINYGAHSKPILSWFTRFSFRNTNLILPVHKSLAQSNYTYIDVAQKKQGIRAFDPQIKTPIIELVNGYDTKKWQILNINRQENSFLTVTFALDNVGYYRKGIDLIVFLANTFPAYHFTIVGQVNLQETCPQNLTLINNVPQDELLNIYNKHQYYLQLSMFEGFPNALCEAMLCGCIPIGSAVAGIPDIIGDQGYLLKRKDKKALAELIKVLENNTILPEDSRNQITQNFSIERRIQEFFKFINHVK